MNTDFSGNIERFSGFADSYDLYRPAPPAILATLLTRLAQIPFPNLVVDLGSGTGLSTRYWTDKARVVIGIEPTEDMRQQAIALTQSENISYREGFSHATGLPDQCAQIITCLQSLHWMDPQATFEEARRILQPGGVFAACDFDWPPVTGSWQADLAYQECLQQASSIHMESDNTPVQQWSKGRHLERMQASGCFRYTKEISVHTIDQGNGDRLYGLARSQGGLMTRLKQGASEEEIGLTKLKEVAQRILGDEQREWIWGARVRIGII